MSKLGLCPSSRRGSAYLLALMVFSILSLLSLALVMSSLGHTSSGRTQVDQKRALYIAEAGLAEAYSAIVAGQPGAIGDRENPARFGDGLLWTEASELGPGEYHLRSHGYCGVAKAILTLVVERPVQGAMQLGLFSAAGLEIPPNALLDGYDSFIGPYALQVGGETLGRAGSNGSITLNGSGAQATEVRADLFPGPEGEIVESGSVRHDGEVEQAEDPVELRAARVPTLDNLGDRQVDGTTTLPSGDLHLGAVTLGPAGLLIIEGPTRLVLDSLELVAGAGIELDPTSGPIDLYVMGDLVLPEGSTVTTLGADPGSLTVHLHAGSLGAPAASVILAATGDLHAQVLAPWAGVSIGSGFELFGGIAAAAIVLEPGTRVHVDQDLIIGAFDSDQPPMEKAWQLEELAEIPKIDGFQDPFHFLGVLREDLNPPHAVRDLTNVHIHIEYVDIFGTSHSENAWEEDFDWSLVQEVLKLKRHEKERKN